MCYLSSSSRSRGCEASEDNMPKKPMQTDSYSCHAGCRSNRRARSAYGRT